MRPHIGKRGIQQRKPEAQIYPDREGAPREDQSERRAAIFGMLAELSVHFDNPHPGESMVIWMKRLKQYVWDEASPGQELVLVGMGRGGKAECMGRYHN